jgi:hypothetical protein
MAWKEAVKYLCNIVYICLYKCRLKINHSMSNENMRQFLITMWLQTTRVLYSLFFQRTVKIYISIIKLSIISCLKQQLNVWNDLQNFREDTKHLKSLFPKYEVQHELSTSVINIILKIYHFQQSELA